MPNEVKHPGHEGQFDIALRECPVRRRGPSLPLRMTVITGPATEHYDMLGCSAK